MVTIFLGYIQETRTIKINERPYSLAVEHMILSHEAGVQLPVGVPNEDEGTEQYEIRGLICEYLSGDDI